MRQLVVAALLVVGLAHSPRAYAYGCDGKVEVPGHTKGYSGIADSPTAPCPVGHYADLQKKRNASALFAQPKGTPQPQNGPQQ